MKTILLIASLVISSASLAVDHPSVIAPSGITKLQVSPHFLFVRGHKQGKGHSIQWKMNSNAGIEKFQVQFTYEDPADPYSNWYVAGQVNNSNSTIFKYTDLAVLPGIVNYRIIAVLNNNAGTVISGCYTTTVSQ